MSACVSDSKDKRLKKLLFGSRGSGCRTEENREQRRTEKNREEKRRTERTDRTEKEQRKNREGQRRTEEATEHRTEKGQRKNREEQRRNKDGPDIAGFHLPPMKINKRKVHTFTRGRGVCILRIPPYEPQ